MSYKQIVGFEDGKAVGVIAEFRNSHGSHPRIWTAINPNFWGTKEDQQATWDAAKDPTLGRLIRAVLIFSFDHTVLRAVHFSEMAQALRLFDDTYPTRPDYINHLEVIAKVLDTCECEAVSLETTVADEWWEGWPDDEDADEPEPYDLTTGTLHRFVFDVLAEGERP